MGQARSVRGTLSKAIRLMLILLAASAGQELDAQPRPVAAAEPLVLSQGSDHGQFFQQPRWSPVSGEIAFAGSEFRGIWIARRDEGSDVKMLTDEIGAGFRFSWSGDGSKILARTSEQAGLRRMHVVKVFDAATGEAQALTTPSTQRVSIPSWLGDASVLVADNGVPTVAEVDAQTAKTGGVGPAILADGNTILRRDPSGGTTVVSREDGDVLNLVVSPDGRRVAFEVMGGSLILMNADGSGRSNQGIGNRPAWSPDGQWIAFQRTFDDGHVTVSSDLWIASADGSRQGRLTDSPGDLEMNPTWAHDGSAIAYDDRGSIFILPLRYE